MGWLVERVSSKVAAVAAVAAVEDFDVDPDADSAVAPDVVGLAPDLASSAPEAVAAAAVPDQASSDQHS